MTQRLFIDLETCQATSEAVKRDIREGIKPPKAIKLQKSIDTWNKDKRAEAEREAISKTSFSGLAGEIICIGFAVDNDDTRSLWRNVGESEAVLLQRFFDAIDNEHGANFNPEIVGHNICEFDLRFIFQRCVICNVKPTFDIQHDAKAWSKFVFDTLYETMGNNKAGGSLDRIAKAFGLEGKLKGFDGSMVNQAWLDGDIKKIALYCENDVEVTRNIYKRLKFIKKIGE